MFLPEIDIKATKANAKRKLREYPRWKRLANDSNGQHITASYSFEPRQKNLAPNRAVERLAINKVDAENELEAIEQAVTGISEQELREIICKKYLSPYKITDKEIYNDMLCSETYLYNRVQEAVINFAELYRAGELVIWEE